MRLTTGRAGATRAEGLLAIAAALVALAAAGNPPPLPPPLPPPDAPDSPDVPNSPGAREAPTAPGVPTAPAALSSDPSREPYIIESLESTFRFEADGTRTRSVRSRVRIQTEAGLREFGQVAVVYESGLERLSIKGRVLRPDGTASEIPDSAVQEVSSEVTRLAPVYSDIRQKHLVVPGLRPGDSLEYELRFDGLAPLSAGQFWTSYDFNHDAVVEDERLRIDVPAGRFVNLKTRPGFDPVVQESDGRRVYSWKSSHLKREPKPKDLLAAILSRSADSGPPAVQLSTFRSWAEVGDWYADLEAGRRAPDEAVRARVAELTAGRTDDLSRLRALYDNVSQKYRYVGIMFGIGRYQPHAAAEILRNQYGDCKDKHTLLAAMAEAAGVRAQAALTSATNPIDADFPSPSQFDHVITYVPREAGALWLDTTTEMAPFGMLSPRIRGKDALVVAPGGGSALRRIPAKPAVPNLENRTIEGAVDEIGTLTADVRLSVRGDAEVMLRAALRRVPESDWPEFLHYVTPGLQMQDDVTAVTTSDLSDTDHALELRFHLVRRNHVNRFETDPHLAFPLGEFGLPDRDDDAAATKPITLGTGMLEYHARVRLPASFTARVPLPVTVKRDYADYGSTYRLDAAVLAADRVLSFKLDEIPASRGNDFTAFLRALGSDLAQTAPLKITGGGKPADIAGVKTDALRESAHAAMTNGDAQTAIALLEQAVKADPTSEEAQSDLGAAYGMAAQFDKAEGALKKAIAMNPYTSEAHTRLGQLYAWTDRPDEAIKEFRRQIEINPLDESTHYLLGHLLLDGKKYAEAEPELAKAATITPNDDKVHLDRGKALLALGKATEARESFARAVEIAPVPHVWNEVAYALADRSIALDQAEEYAASAAATLAAQSMSLHLESLRVADLQLMGLLGATWDTLGWVYFKRGKLDAGERYLKAAWELTQEGTVALHLATLHEKAGRSARAIEYYALAAAAPRSAPAARDRLKSLLGDIKAHTTIEKTRQDMQNLRSQSVPGASGDGTAEFFVMLRPSATVEEVRYIGGDAAMKPLAAALKRTTFNLTLPAANDLRVVRRGFLVCSKSYSGPVQLATPAAPKSAPPPGGSCDFIMMLPRDVHSLN